MPVTVKKKSSSNSVKITYAKVVVKSKDVDAFTFLTDIKGVSQILKYLSRQNDKGLSLDTNISIKYFKGDPKSIKGFDYEPAGPDLEDSLDANL